MNSEDSLLPPPAQAMELARQTRNPLRKLYYWTLHWAETKYALPALIFVSFIESSFFPIPPDILLMAMCFANPKRWVTYAAWCTIASVAGALLGYFIGWGLYESVGRPIVNFYNGAEIMEKVRLLYDEYGFVGVLTAAITPIPYKVFTIASGVFTFSLWQLIIASLIGRGFRFFLVAGLIRGFGPRIRPFLEKHFEIAMLLMLVVGILGVVAIKFIPH